MAAVIWVGGCAGSRPLRPELPDSFPDHTLEQVRQQLRAALADSLMSFAARADLSVRSPAFSGRATARIKHRRNDSLLVMLRSATLGIEAARILSTPDSFFYYNRIAKQLTYGSADDASQFLPGFLAGEEIFPQLLGMLSPESGAGWTLDADTTHYSLRDEASGRRYIIDPAIWRVIHYEHRLPSGALVEAITFADFFTVSGVYVPRRIIMRRPMAQTNAALYYRELALNPPALDLSLRAPRDVKRAPAEAAQR